jgi:hypothetical protein
MHEMIQPHFKNQSTNISNRSHFLNDETLPNAHKVITNNKKLFYFQGQKISKRMIFK